MRYKEDIPDDTIVAIATPAGRGGIGIVRLSGVSAYDIACQLTKKKQLIPRKAHYCPFYDPKHDVIDEGVVLYFKAPHSFTGEDVVEFQGHGSPIVLDRLVQNCVHYGARLASPGEFSLRAFLNDKIDLTQAEAIADLINAHSETAARMALRSLQGDFSKKINELCEQLISLRLYVEAAIDFPEEEIDFLSEQHLLSLFNTILLSIIHLRDNASQGVMLREGISVVIAGRPNAGKSTLMNALSGRDVAIVTSVAGTTRDVMRESVLLDDLPLHLIDTAGLRDSDDVVEQEGIKRAWQEVRRADCLLMVMDALCPDEDQNQLTAALQEALPPNVPVIWVFNKRDQLDTWVENEDHIVYISAKSGDGLSILKNKIKKKVGYQSTEGQFLARRRHLHALDTARGLLLLGHEQLEKHKALELFAEDLRLAHQSLCDITGEFSSDDLLGEIFSSFCIGK